MQTKNLWEQTKEIIEVYYWKHGDWLMNILGYSRFPSIKDIKRDYVKLPIEFYYNKDIMVWNNLETVFIKLNGNQGPNPLGTVLMQSWLRANGLRHTSMSVGDVVKIGTQYWVVDDVGFKEIED